jgi:hypothetical protein
MEMLILWSDVGLMTLEEDVFADLSEGKDPSLFLKANPNMNRRKYINSRSEVAILSCHGLELRIEQKRAAHDDGPIHDTCLCV